MKYRECAVSNIRCNEAVNGPLLSVKLMQSFPDARDGVYGTPAKPAQTANPEPQTVPTQRDQHLHTVLHRHLSFWTFSDKTNTVKYIHQGSKLAQWHIMKNK